MLFTYTRLASLKRTVDSLKACFLASDSELIVFSDGAKGDKDRESVLQVRQYLKSLNGFKNVKLVFSETNKGLANSIIHGVTEVLTTYEAAIVLEDDLIFSSNFLCFMNQGLSTYIDCERVVAISGYSIPVKLPRGYTYDSYFTQRTSSWGWATWKTRWEKVDWTLSDYGEFINNRERVARFNAIGSDLSQMLKKQKHGKIDSWAIRWCFHQFKHDLYTAFPIVSKVLNLGFGEEATHTKNAHGRFDTVLDISGKKTFNYEEEMQLHQIFIDQLRAKYSLYTRAFYKIKGVLSNEKK